MTDSELHPYVELIAREERRPVVIDPGARGRVMAAVRAQPLPRRRRFWGALEPRSLMVSPLAGTLLAAGLVGVGVLLGGLATNRDGREPAGQPNAVAEGLPVSDTVFVFVAPRASKVSLVGDFNDCDDTKSP